MESSMNRTISKYEMNWGIGKKNSVRTPKNMTPHSARIETVPQNL